MKYLAPKLKHRVQIQVASNVPGQLGMQRDYTAIGTIWASVEPLNLGSINFGIEQIRHRNVQDIDTHTITVRWAAISRLGRAFTAGFSTGFDAIADFHPIKSEYSIYLLGSSTSTGRRFRVNRVAIDERFREFAVIKVTEFDEVGTGARDGWS